jgi:hypothetical protein
VTNDPGATSPAAPTGHGLQKSAATTRILSEADLAIFALLAGQLDLSGDVRLSLDPLPRQPVPQALLAALLTAEAVRVAGQSSHARVTSAALRYPEQAYTDAELRLSAQFGAPDPAGALHVTVEIHSEDERLLASGVVLVIPG